MSANDVIGDYLLARSRGELGEQRRMEDIEKQARREMENILNWCVVYGVSIVQLDLRAFVVFDGKRVYELLNRSGVIQGMSYEIGVDPRQQFVMMDEYWFKNANLAELFCYKKHYMVAGDVADGLRQIMVDGRDEQKKKYSKKDEED